jgi:actin-like ATPase involved in cell morphogenesis
MPFALRAKTALEDVILDDKFEEHKSLRLELEKISTLPSCIDTIKMMITNAEKALRNIGQVPEHEREQFQAELKFYQELVKSPDHEQIFDCCLNYQTKEILKKILQETWSKLPRAEAKLRSDIWEKIDPLYEKAAQIFIKDRPRVEQLRQLVTSTVP